MSAIIRKPWSNKTNWAQILEDCRNNARLTKKDFAYALGVDMETLNGWYAGTAEPTPDAMVRMLNSVHETVSFSNRPIIIHRPATA